MSILRSICNAAAVVLLCVPSTAGVSAQQPISHWKPIEVGGDTLGDVDFWDVQYDILPELGASTSLRPTGTIRSTLNNRHGKIDHRVSPAEYYQPDGSETIPQPSYLDPADGPARARPSYLDTGDEPSSVGDELDRIYQRLDALETTDIAHEDATRTIIRRSFAEQGSNINSYVIFGGTLESLVFWAEGFDGTTESDIVLDTAELDFEIQVNRWTLGSLVFEYSDGTDFFFPTTEDDEIAVDRVNVRQAWITVGDPANYPLFATIGRDVVPFGISTGDPVADVLTISDPLTVEAFETSEDFVMFGFAGPICCPPPLDPNAPPGPPLVKGVLINPLVRRAATFMCSYRPCTPPPPPPLPPPLTVTCPPPFSGAIYFYNGDTFDDGEDHIEHIGGTLGYQTRGVLPYRCIPWSLDFDVDINSSVFDSDFLQYEYRGFLDQIGYVPGMASHVKANVGATAWVLEWNGALDDAEFTDDDLNDVSIRPSSWQIAFAYQFGWNRSVEVIGAQGTYFTIGYSETTDLAGVTRSVGDPMMPTLLRVGNVPEKRLSVGMGEWVLDGLRVALEYSYAVDYDVDEGGTGGDAQGVFMQVTYEW